MSIPNTQRRGKSRKIRKNYVKIRNINKFRGDGRKEKLKFPESKKYKSKKNTDKA